MTTQRHMVQASLARPTYADRCAVPRRPMVPREAAAAFLNAAIAAGVRPAAPTFPNFNVNRSTH